MSQTEIDNKIKLREKFQPSYLVIGEDFGSQETLDFCGP